MLDKTAILFEIENVFNIVNACFDRKALYRILIAARYYNDVIRKMALDAGLDKFIYEDYKGKDNKGKIIPIRWEENAFKIVREMTPSARETDTELVVDWVFAYQFMPEAVNVSRSKNEIERFKELVDKEPTKDHNFIGFLMQGIKWGVAAYVRKEKKYDILSEDSLKDLQKKIENTKDEDKKQ